jgi:hypothetical protein
VGERASRAIYRYSQGRHPLRRWVVRYCLSANHKQRESTSFVDIRYHDGYPWGYEYHIPMAFWDLYRLAIIALSTFGTSIAIAALFHG